MELWTRLKEAVGLTPTELVFPGFEQAIGIAYFDAHDFHQRGAALAAAKNSKAPSSTTTG